MSTILHILNGDAALSGFNETGLEGDVLIWREILSEGPLQENILSGSFWGSRLRWISEELKENPDNYQHKVIDELGKLNSDYTEINLWFEFDLHCQVNLLGVMQMLSRKMDMSAPSVYLICLADCVQFNFAKGLGELTGDQFEELYDSRERLNTWEFELATQAWQLYVKGDATELKQWLNNNNFWGGIPLLKPALQAHLKRLQVNEAGLGYIEQRLLNIYNSGAKTKSAIYATFWNEDKIYGMGDVEIDIYLNRLQQLKLIQL